MPRHPVVYAPPERADKVPRIDHGTLVQLLEGVADWVWQADTAGRFVYSNGRVRDILGVAVEDVLGRTRFEFMSPQAIDEVRGVFELIAQRGEPVQDFECPMRRRDGTDVILECSARPIIDAAGGLQGYCGIDRDITRAKSYESERERLILQLGQALAEVKTLSGLLPICAGCKKIRDDHGYWQHLEKYISQHSQAHFSHGLCPDCANRLYGVELEQVPSPVTASTSNDRDHG